MKKPSKLLTLLLAVILIAAAVSFFTGKDTGAVINTAANIAEAVINETTPTAEPDKTQMPEETPSPTVVPEEAPAPTEEPAEVSEDEPEDAVIDEHGTYTTKDDVALYIHTYGRLPENFVTKKEAEAAGWTGGSLEKYLPGKCIGGSYFGNHEGILPKAKGRKWTECDINTLGKSSRGAERIVFSNDGLIYYTNDHYESFEQLY